jgi:hypothetical protein
MGRHVLVSVASPLSTYHLGRNNKDWSGLIQDNVSEWSDMSTHRLLIHWAGTKNSTEHDVGFLFIIAVYFLAYFYSFWFDLTGTRTHYLPHSRREHANHYTTDVVFNQSGYNTEYQNLDLYRMPKPRFILYTKT